MFLVVAFFTNMGGGHMYQFEVENESEYPAHHTHLDEDGAIREAARKNCIVAYY